MHILYITYDGLMEPLGQSQVLAYIEKLSLDSDLAYTILSFEKAEDLDNFNLNKIIQKRCNDSSIDWTKSKYHRYPSMFATFYDILKGLFKSFLIIKRNKVRVIHARSYVPALIALIMKKLMGIKYIFDMRGFWADERVDGGLWKKDSFLYFLTKNLEKQFLLNADHVVSLTESGIKEMKKFSYLNKNFPNYSVIPTCTDLNRFKSFDLEKKDSFTLGYLGTAGTWYQFHDVVKAFGILLSIDPNSNFLIINKDEHEYINSEFDRLGISRERVELISSSYDDIPFYINKMDAAIFFIKPVFSKQSSSPTKLAEILGCGVPCLSNKGVGDMSPILDKNNAGFTIADFTTHSIEKGLRALIALTNEEDIKQRCISTAKEYFSLENGVRQYKEIYSDLRN